MPGRRAPEAARREQLLEAAFIVAARRRLEGLTIRSVAEQAGLSPGLVLFHFQSREGLLLALLDWLLRTTVIGEPSPEVLALPTPAARLMGLVRQELLLLPERRPRLELFFDYWVAGIADSKIRKRIRAALERYRHTILPFAEAAVAERRQHFRKVSGADLAGLIVAMIEGYVVQIVVEPAALDIERILTSVETLLAPRAQRSTVGSARRVR